MDLEFTEETANRLSSISSEVSSRDSISSQCDEVTIVKKKSSSLSCLPDHVPDSEQNSFTLPPNLNTVKPFEENLLSKEVSLAQSLYKTAECLESPPRSKYEFSDKETDQRSGHDENNCEGRNGEVADDTDPLQKKELELTEINTVTHTFVRASALDILAKFPKTETVSEVMDENCKQSGLKSVNEDSQEELEDGVDVKKTSSKAVSESKRENEVSSWSTTDDVKKMNKKKGLFNKKSKDNSISVPESKSTEKLANPKAGKKGHKTRIRKEKAKSAQSIGWKIFRKQHSAKDDEEYMEVKSKKGKTPLKKSQSFDNNSSPKNPQLKRMDSIRKIFKKRQPVLPDESSTIDNVKCVEISSPILKTEMKSKHLVEREFFMRDRALQMDTTKIKRVASENKPAVCSSKVKVNNNESTSSLKVDNDESKDESVVGNGFVDQPESPETEEDPVPPVRHKHLEKKRVSMQCDEVSVEQDSTEDENNYCDNHQAEKDKNDLKSNRKDDVDLKKFLNEVKLNDTDIPSTNTILKKEHSEEDEEKNDFVFVDPEPVVERIVNDEIVILGSVTDDVSSISNPTSSSSQVCQSPPIPLESPGSDGEVFEDCIDEDISFNRAVIDKSKESGQDSSPVSVNMPAGRSVSDITSQTSADVFAKGKKEKPHPHSFSGVRSSSSTNTPPRRTMTVFRPLKFEPAESSTLITDMVPVTFPNFPSDRRSQIALELFTTERTYVRGLETMIELFKKPMLSGMDEKDVEKVFSNIDDIYAVNKDLLFLLWEKIKHWSNEQCIAQMFIDMEERFKIYAIYCKNFDKADTFLKKRIKRKPDFDSFLKTCYQDPLCQPGLDLPAYLITIVQRIPRYLLLLKDFYKKTAQRIRISMFYKQLWQE
ncbi:uncharacterized protein LOC114525321 isoform X2 [Dendronephthya gigantea]|uniref:uncharacterized protein LOC114525321 isoform X2 n=1 Tax=Dendronephthya gigantea TaxID=151771 RepID=UPI00106AA6BA|nr:uncharacterized protein LOC114525321 isoform X2 [Dendronephthya gigantea]